MRLKATAKTKLPDRIPAADFQKLAAAGALSETTGKANNHHEHDLQVSIIEWANMSLANYPELYFLYAVPNGGLRHPAISGQMVAEGLKPGIPDLQLDLAARGFHGLRIELKWGSGKLSDHQKFVHAFLRLQNYSIETCYDFDSAQRLLIWYLSETTPEAVKRREVVRNLLKAAPTPKVPASTKKRTSRS